MLKNKSGIIPEFDDIQEAYDRIKKIVHKTPVLTSDSINKMTGSEIFFKCENLQKAGSFKYRGATNSILQLTDDIRNNGVATHSSGNFAQALSLAASIQGINAYIVMPENAPTSKVEAVRSYGGEITFCKPTLEARESTTEIILERTGAAFLHPYNDFNVICGQGTSAFEFLNDYPELEIIMAPVGGGGLISGTAIASTSIKSSILIYAAEPEGADDAYHSFITGSIVPSINPNTICDGLLTSLGSLTFPIIKANVDSILRVDDEIVIKSMKLIWERMKIIVEPSSATVLAAIFKYPEQFSGKKVGVILSGGNLDLNNLPWQNI